MESPRTSRKARTAAKHTTRPTKGRQESAAKHTTHPTKGRQESAAKHTTRPTKGRQESAAKHTTRPTKELGAAKSPRRASTKRPPADEATKPVRLLSGGNPQIAKADGDAPVQEYIAALPGWKRDVGRWLDALIVRHVPKVRKAVKWNSPLYGIDGRGWFLGVHSYTRYLKITFFRGTALRPIPPGASKIEGTRYFDIHENDKLDDAQMAKWVKQAAALPGWIP